MRPDGYNDDPVMTAFQRARAEAARRFQRVKAKVFRRRIMARLFEQDGKLTGDAQAFVGMMADAAELGAIGMADDARAETWRAGRQSLVREIMGWFDVSEQDLMQMRRDAATMEDGSL